MMSQESLLERFHRTFPRRGTHGSILEALKKAPGQAGQLAVDLDMLACTFAGALLCFTTLRIADYELGYPKRGPASAHVRKQAVRLIQPDAEVSDPSKAAAQKLT